MMKPKFDAESLYPMTTEEYFVIQRCNTTEEAKALLEAFREQRARVESLVKWLLDSANPMYTGMSDEYREKMKDAARIIKEQESNIALLRGWIAGMEARDAPKQQ